MLPAGNFRGPPFDKIPYCAIVIVYDHALPVPLRARFRKESP